MAVARARAAGPGLPVGSARGLIVRFVVLAAVILAAVVIFNRDRGLPLAILIVMGLALLFWYITEQTRFGRHLFATGGNDEAARRSGIRINRVRITVFMLSSSLAAAGGILAASRLLAVNQSSGGSDLLLSAIAGPVIAGTSLFGGRGSVWSALLGALVIGSITNGMNLLSVSSSVRYIVTGAVLMAAVTLEAATRPRAGQRSRVTAPATRIRTGRRPALDGGGRLPGRRAARGAPRGAPRPAVAAPRTRAGRPRGAVLLAEPASTAASSSARGCRRS